MDVKTVYVFKEVFDKNNNKYVNVALGVFNKEDEDTLIDPQITETQNKEAELTFQVNARSEKWNNIYDPENLYLVDGKVFSANFSDCINRNRDSNDEDIITIVAYERQKLLTRDYVKIWNTETGFTDEEGNVYIDDFMVMIVSGGDKPLKNNGNLVNSKFPKGSSGYVLEGLLYGTGWTVGTCDIYEYKEGELVRDEQGNPVYAKFDLETDQETIYDNILHVQELWGGILIFDSVNKIVHHRDETLYLPYTGFEVKYQKNLVSSEFIGDNKIITQLCPLGEGSLNIKTVNNGSLWLTNFSYTNNIYKEIVNNPDITDDNQLKRWGERKLASLCHPRKELTVNIILLNQLEGFELEEIHLNDIVDVIDYNYIENKTEQLRVISYTHKIWDLSDASVTIGDITLETTDIFRRNVSATNKINNGTLDVSRVVDFLSNGQSLKEIIKQIDQVIILTKSELMKADDEITARVTQTEVSINNLDNEIVETKETVSELSVTTDGIISNVSQNYVSKNGIITDLNSRIQQTAEKISIEGNKIYIKSTYFTLTEDGKIIATGGEIAGFILERYNNESHLYKQYNSNMYSGLVVPDGLTEANKNRPLLYAGSSVKRATDLSKINSYITHNGLGKFKWLTVDVEAGYFYTEFSNGKRAMTMDTYSIDWKLNNELNNTFAKLNRGSPLFELQIHDARGFTILDSVHEQINKKIATFVRFAPESSDINAQKGHYVSLTANTFVEGNSPNNTPYKLYVQGYEVNPSASDKRLKKYIKTSKDNALNKVNKIRIADFYWKKNINVAKPNQHILNGYIAQEVQAIDETLVDYNQEKDTYQMNLLNLSALQAKAIQELSQKNEKLNNNLNKMAEILTQIGQKLNLDIDMDNLLNKQ